MALLKIFCILYALITRIHVLFAAPTCAPAPESALQAQWLDIIQDSSEHESLFTIDIFRSLIEDELALSDSPNVIHLFGDQDSNHCNMSHIQKAAASRTSSLQDRSYCPWYNIINHSDKRYPADLAESRCRCRYGAGMGVLTSCSPVYYHIQVLRKTEECDEQGFFKYVAGWQRLSVGCTMIQAVQS